MKEAQEILTHVKTLFGNSYKIIWDNGLLPCYFIGEEEVFNKFQDAINQSMFTLGKPFYVFIILK